MTAQSLHVIDMAPLFDHDAAAARRRTADAIEAACRTTGFFYLAGHRIAAHSPTPYKALAIGDHAVNGMPLPTNGFF